jgi:uncharacterized repeat protein (TIGR01451 family)
MTAVLVAGACSMTAPRSHAGGTLPVADLSITITNGVSTAVSGESVTYTITASNAGPDAASGATVVAALQATSWTCVGAGGGTCTSAGTGNIGDTVNLPVGASVTYSATRSVPDFAAGQSANASITWSGGTDPNPANNSAWDEDDIVERSDLALTMAAPGTAHPGSDLTYTLSLVNQGPSQTVGHRVVDDLPAGTTFLSAAGPSLVGFTTPPVGATGPVTAVVNENVPVGASLVLTIVVRVDPAMAPGAVLTNTATVTAASDTDPTDNSASASTVIAVGPTSTVAATTAASSTAPTVVGSTSTTAVATTTTTSTSSTTTRPRQRATATSLASSANPSTVGQAVTFAATVTARGGAPSGFRAVTPLAASPLAGGTVEFRDGATVLAVVRVDGGRATFTTSSLPAGTRTITATFRGTATAAASSATLAQQVKPALLPASR